MSRLLIDIPAIADYVKYLREKDDSQKKLDALTAQVSHLTERLKQSSTALKTAVDQENK